MVRRKLAWLALGLGAALLGAVGVLTIRRPQSSIAEDGSPADAAATPSFEANESPRDTRSAEPSASAAVAPAGMLRVPGGRFTMGADRGGEADERPAHAVTVVSFWLDATEVTNAAYQVCVDAGVCRAPDPTSSAVYHLPDAKFRAPQQPVNEVSWSDARAYCAFVGKRLPSEAEWERAARGDDDRRFPWGNAPITPEHAVYESQFTSEGGRHPAGNGPYGHADLIGNVWEWVEDEFDPYAYRRASAPQGKPGSCKEILNALDELRRSGQQGFTGSNPLPNECEHVLRGAGFNYQAKHIRITNRVHHPGRMRLVMAGFRCALDVR